MWVVLLYLLPSSDGLAILLFSRSVGLAHCCPGSGSSETLAPKSSGQDFEVRQARSVVGPFPLGFLDQIGALASSLVVCASF